MRKRGKREIEGRIATHRRVREGTEGQVELR